jgi:hypothetical protein
VGIARREPLPTERTACRGSPVARIRTPGTGAAHRATHQRSAPSRVSFSPVRLGSSKVVKEPTDTRSALEDTMSTNATTAAMIVKITPNDHGNPAGKLADAELHFSNGPLAGLKLIGFAIWERRGGSGRNVTFPARQYAVNGERRSFALLRPIVDTTAQNSVRDLILEAYAEFEARVDA